MKPIEIFRAGTHTAMSGRKVTITTADLAACAAAYDRQHHEAPIVVGHPKGNAPAFGWVDRLELQGDILIAHPHQVEPTFSQMVEGNLFKKRSASFYAPDDVYNPKPGIFSLKHVGFLGAAPPAVYGLKDVDFAAGETALEFANWQDLNTARLFGRIRDFLIAQFGQEKADTVISADDVNQMTIDAAQPEPEPCPPASPAFSQGAKMTEAEIAAIVAENERLKGGAIAFAQQQKTARTALFTTFVEGLITEGKLPTGHKAPLIAFMAGLPSGDDASFEFAQADGTSAKADPAEWLQGFLKTLPKLVTTREIAPHNPGEEFAQGEPLLDAGKIYGAHNRTTK